MSTGKYANKDRCVKYGLNVVYKKLKNVLYIEVLKCIYGMLK